MTAKRVISRSLAGLPGFEASLHRATGRECLVFAGHVISDRRLAHVRHLYRYRNVQQFERDLDHLQSRYRALSLKEVQRSVKNGWSLPPDSFLLTFDDGLRECSEVIAPILLRRGLPAIFFLTSGAIDNQLLLERHKVSLLVESLATAEPDRLHAASEACGAEHFEGVAALGRRIIALRRSESWVLDVLAGILEVDFAAFLANERPYLTREEVDELAGQGFAIGAHSVTHPEYQSLTPAERLEETRQSLAFIEPWRQEMRAFAFPFSDRGLPLEVFEELRRTGVEVSFGTAGPRRDAVNWSIQRLPLENGCTQIGENIAIGLSKAAVRQVTGRLMLERSLDEAQAAQALSRRSWSLRPAAWTARS